jgi:drug/metabolite transporter (DMT)-like permease
MTDPKALVSLLLTVFIWGIGPVFLRSLSVALGPADHLVIRYTIVTVIYLIGLAILGGWRIAREDWPRLIAISIIGLVGYNLGSAFGFELVSAGVGSLIIGTQPLIIAILAAMLTHEKLTIPAVIGLIVGLAGIAALFWQDLMATGTSGTSPLGVFYVFLCGVAWAFYVVMAKPLVRKYGSYPVTALSISICTVPMVAGLVSAETFTTLGTMTTRNWLDMFYMVVISTVIATIIWNYGASRLSAATTGATLYFVPVIGVIAGALMLGEEIGINTLVGGALILTGVGIAQFGPMLMKKPQDRMRPPKKGKYRRRTQAAIDRMESAKREARLLGLAAVIFAVTMWGLIPVAMRFLILDIRPETVMILRLVPAGLIALVVVSIIGVRRIAWQDWLRLTAAALAGNVAYQILAAYGMQSVPASWTGILFGLEPVFIALFAVLILKDKLTPWLVGGIALALAGTGVLMLGSLSAPAGEVGLIGLILVTLSTMGWGIYTVLIKPVSAKYGSFPVACLALGISALPMIVFVTPDIGETLARMTLVQWAAVFFVVVFATFLATSAWNYALGQMESSLAGMFLYVQPLVAAVGGILLLNERLSWPLVAGGLLIILGVAVAQFGPRLRMGALQRPRSQHLPQPVE